MYSNIGVKFYFGRGGGGYIVLFQKLGQGFDIH